MNIDEDKEGGEVHMDAMAFGMGCCCLQVTMQARSDRESRFLHDQMTPLAPIFLALSAASPIFRGHLVDTDTRWDVIGGAVDDRTDAERRVSGTDTSAPYDEGLVAGGVKQLQQSRYSSVARYIAIPSVDSKTSDAENLEALNDVPAALDEQALKVCLDKGLDSTLAKHVAHLFARDPLVVFDDAVFLDNESVLDHFDNIQSTNWRTIRWKPPALEAGHEASRRVVEEGAGKSKSKSNLKFLSFSILVVSCFMRSAALDSSDILLPYSIISLA